MSVLQSLASVAPVRIQAAYLGAIGGATLASQWLPSYISRRLAVFSLRRIMTTSRPNRRWYRKYEFRSASATLEICKSSKDT